MKIICRSLLATFCLLTWTFSMAQGYEFYVSDAGNYSNPPWQILKFNEDGTGGEVFIDSNLAWPQDILFLEDQGIVLISNLNSGLINKHDAETGAYVGTFASGISGPTRMKIGPDGLLYVLQWSGNGKVMRYTIDGVLMNEFTETGVNQSIGLDWDSEGNLYVSSYSLDKVQKFSSTGEDMGVFIGNGLIGPTNICFEDDGNLLVVDYDGGAVKRFSSEGEFIENFITGTNNAEGLAFLENGNILLGNGGTSAIKLYTSEGEYIEDIVPSGTLDLITPNAVILREIITDLDLNTASIEHSVYPTLGNRFYLKSDVSNEFRAMEVFDSAGELIFSKPVSDSLLWEASGVLDGQYMMVLITAEGIRKTQKIMVQH